MKGKEKRWQENQKMLAVCPDCRGTGVLPFLTRSGRYAMRRCYRCKGKEAR